MFQYELDNLLVMFNERKYRVVQAGGSDYVHVIVFV